MFYEEGEACKGSKCCRFAHIGAELAPILYAVFGNLSKAVDNAECGNDIFLCDQARDHGNRSSPEAEAEGSKEPGDRAADDGEQGIIDVFDHAERAVFYTEALQEPEHNGGEKNDGAGFLDEGPAALPHGVKQVLHGGHMVLGKLHNEGRGIARKELCLLENKSCLGKVEYMRLNASYTDVHRGTDSNVCNSIASAREKLEDGVSAEEFVKILKKYNKNAVFFENLGDLMAFFESFDKKETVFLFVGAGDLQNILYKNRFVE